MQEQKISEKIKAKWTDEGICVEMPEDLAAELESVLVERYGIVVSKKRCGGISSGSQRSRKSSNSG